MLESLFGGQKVIPKQETGIQELESHKNQNSSNSSKPSSSDFDKSGKRHKKKLELTGKTKKCGALKEHRSKTLKMVSQDEVGEAKALKSIRCKCGKRLKRQPMKLHSPHQLFDIFPRQLSVTGYQQCKYACSNCSLKNCGSYLEFVKILVQYGNCVRTFST